MFSRNNEHRTPDGSGVDPGLMEGPAGDLPYSNSPGPGKMRRPRPVNGGGGVSKPAKDRPKCRRDILAKDCALGDFPPRWADTFIHRMRVRQFPQRQMRHMPDMQPASGMLALGRAAFDTLVSDIPSNSCAALFRAHSHGPMRNTPRQALARRRYWPDRTGGQRSAPWPEV
jgi:hypothetical protein